MDSEMTVRIVAGALAVLCVAVIVMRRKGKKSGADNQDDF
jgi:hypothetical protein